MGQTAGEPSTRTGTGRTAMKNRLLAAASIAAMTWSWSALSDTTLSVMTFNVYGGGANDGKPVDETVAAIKAAGADIIGMQETRLESDPCEADYCPATGESVAKAIAEKLGFHYYDQTKDNAALGANAIISLFRSDRRPRTIPASGSTWTA